MSQEGGRMDEQIRRAESVINGMSTHDATLQLTFNVARLTESVNLLSSAVESMKNDVHGSEGLRAEVRDIKRSITELKEKGDRAEAILWKIAWIFGIIGLFSILANPENYLTVFLEHLAK
jgi:seryl-tRNA synthetase